MSNERRTRIGYAQTGGATQAAKGLPPTPSPGSESSQRGHVSRAPEASPAPAGPLIGGHPEPRQQTAGTPQSPADPGPEPGVQPGVAPAGGQRGREALQAGDATPSTERSPGTRPVSKALYLSLHFGGTLLGFALLAWGLTDPNVEELIPFAPLPLLVGLVAFWVLLYKAWAALQDGQTRPSPGKAVGFCFIPVFNIYWVFVAIGSWPEKYNRCAQRRGVDGFRASEGLFIAHVVLHFLLGVVAVAVTLPLCISQMCDGINALARGNLPQARVRR